MDSKVTSSFPPRDISLESQPKAGACQVRMLRSPAEIDEVSEEWKAWQNHPNANMHLFRLVMDTQEEVKQPNVVAILRQGVVESLLLARTEEARVPVKLGYL